jgi:anaerobic magnesium-protoporphyrin IX monomethyl ester cyclase
MKIAFVIPPVLDGTHDVDRCFGCNYSMYFLPLLAALYPATVLKEQGHEVAVHDFAAQRVGKQAFLDFLHSDDSEAYCFYTVFLSQETDRKACDMLRQEHPAARFVFFGPQPTWQPELFLDRPNTYVVRGESELTFGRLMDVLKAGAEPVGIEGLSYSGPEGMVHNPPARYTAKLDTLPIPDRTLVDHRPYCNPKLHSRPHTAMLTSRGCYAQCTYCVPNSLSYARELEHKKHHGVKPPVRTHSAERVIEEFRKVASLGFRSVSVIDDQFLWDEARTVKICEGIKDLKLEWSCLARCDRVSDGAAEAMARAGCAYVDLGTESFDQQVLDSVKKGIRADATERAVRILKKHGVSVELNVLFGATPVETEETIGKTLRELRRLDVDYVLFSVANPFPGTEFYSAAKANGWMAYGDYIPVDPAKHSIITYPHLPKERLEQILAHAYRSHYFHPRTLWRELRKVRSVSDFADKCRAGARLLKRTLFR